MLHDPNAEISDSYIFRGYLTEISLNKKHWPAGGWYSRLVRDEVLGEWCFTGGLALHLHCHISGNAFSLVPSGYRNFVFRREMPLVIDSIAYAEKWFNPAAGVPPSLQSVPIFVHFESGDPRLSRVECWGCLGEWVNRESALGTVKHIESVSRTLPGVIPAVPVAFMAGGERGSLQLDGKLERFMVAFESFVVRVLPGFSATVVHHRGIPVTLTCAWC